MKSTDQNNTGVTTIKGATVVSADSKIRADIRIEGDRVAAVGDLAAKGHVVDASAMFVMPGMVDTHVHLMDPGDTSREDFPTGTAAAAVRGVTTIVEHSHSAPVRYPSDLEEKRHWLHDRSHVDFGLAAHVWPNSTGAIADLAEAGVSFFKIFTCDTHGVPGLDSDMIRVALDEIGKSRSAALVHNEDQELTASAERRLRSSGRIDPGLLIEWRSREAELTAVADTSAAAAETNARVTIAHVSNPSVLDVIDKFVATGADLAAEACPQYLALREDEVNTHGALRKFTPPARSKSEDDDEAMWTALRGGRFSHVSTDHAPSTVEQKTAGDFWEAPFGLPGLDTTLPYLIDAALRDRLDMSDVVRLYSTEPARRYNLRKGRIEAGSPADIVIIDPTSSWTVDDADIVSKAGWSPFSGTTFLGRTHRVYLRGREIARDGAVIEPLTGRFLTPVR